MGSAFGDAVFFTREVSPIVAVASEIILPSIDAVRPHCFVGAEFFDDLAGTLPVLPSAGTLTFTVATLNSGQGGQFFERITNGVIDFPDIMTCSWAANTTHVKAVPAGIVGATHFRIVVTCNTT